MFYIWIGIIILLTIVELLTVKLTTVYFGFSGIVALLLSFRVESFPIQFAVFAILGIILLVTTKPTLEKLLKRTPSNLDQESILGMQGVVIDAMRKNHPGTIKVGGKVWAAISQKKIKVGSTVKILEVDGMTLKVAPVEEEV